MTHRAIIFVVAIGLAAFPLFSCKPKSKQGASQEADPEEKPPKKLEMRLGKGQVLNKEKQPVSAAEPLATWKDYQTGSQTATLRVGKVLRLSIAPKTLFRVEDCTERLIDVSLSSGSMLVAVSAAREGHVRIRMGHVTTTTRDAVYLTEHIGEEMFVSVKRGKVDIDHGNVKVPRRKILKANLTFPIPDRKVTYISKRRQWLMNRLALEWADGEAPRKK